MSKSLSPGLTGSAKTRPAMKKFRRPLDIFDSEALDCVYGQYPWDDWERDALVAGVPRELAGLGRLVMREGYQHDWSERLKSLCGWYDRGQRMIRLALRSPQTAERRWQRLLDTDGYRGRWRTTTNDEQTREWISYR